MANLFNRVWMTTPTTGTGTTIALGSASTGYQSFASAGVADGDTVSYVIEDGNDWEIGVGTYNSSGPSISRWSFTYTSTGYGSGSLINPPTIIAGSVYQGQKIYGSGIPDNTYIKAGPDTLGQYITNTSFTVTGGTAYSSQASSGYRLNLSGSATIFLSAQAGDLLYSTTDSAFVLPSGYDLSIGAARISAPNTNILAGIKKYNPNIALYNLNNAGFGYGALNNISSYVNNNVAVGYQAGGNLGQNGTNNVILGYNALYQNLSGNGNIAIGYAALGKIVSYFSTFTITNGGSGYVDGSYTAVPLVYVSGPTTLNNAYPTVNITVSGGVVTAVTLNTAAGPVTSIDPTTTTVSNTNLGGTGSGLIITCTATNASNLNYNTAIGYNAFGNITTNSGNNVGLGYQVGYNTTGSSNTFVGYNTGSGNTTGTNNVFYGYSAGSSNTTGSNNTILGGSISNAGGSNTNSNWIVIGDGSGTARFVTDNNGATRFGSNTTPNSRFEISAVNLSKAAWTTSGIRVTAAAATYTDTSSTGTVANVYGDAFKAITFAASSATTYTNAYGSYFEQPVAGTNVTATNRWALGAANANIVGALSVGGATTLAAGTTTLAPLTFLSGTNLTTAAAGVMEYDGTVPYFSMAASTRGALPTEQLVVLGSTYTLTSQTAAQKLFNATTNGAVTLPVGTYQFECVFSLSSMSASSGSFGFALGVGTAVIGSQGWYAAAQKGTATLATATALQFTYNTAANTTLATASANTVGYAIIRGFFRVTTAGTVIPQVSLGVAAAAVVGVQSYFKVSPVSSTNAAATNITVGNWS